VLVREERLADARADLERVGLAADAWVPVFCEVDTPWTRDWGPHQVATPDGRRALVDHVFLGYPWVPADCTAEDITYRWDPADTLDGEDLAVAALARALDLPTVELPAVATGGNLLTDGHGRAFCTEAQRVENLALPGPAGPLDDAGYRALLRERLGIRDLVVLENTEPVGIQHIDCWMKVVDAETLLVKRAPEGHPEHAPVERNVERLRALRTPSGGRYRILRIDCPPFRGDELPAYTNSLVLNGVVHVPLFGGEADARALATYRAAYPGHEVKGYPHPGWRYFDALHCRARALHAAPRDAAGQPAPALEAARPSE
jgi:agmatine/peptidylarginine deiminase